MEVLLGQSRKRGFGLFWRIFELNFWLKMHLSRGFCSAIGSVALVVLKLLQKLGLQLALAFDQISLFYAYFQIPKIKKKTTKSYKAPQLSPLLSESTRNMQF